MRKLVLASMVFLAVIACQRKNNDDKNPMKPINPAADSQQVQDSKKAAQAELKKKEGQTPAAGDTTNAGGTKDDKSTTKPDTNLDPNKKDDKAGSQNAATPATPTTPPGTSADSKEPKKEDPKANGSTAAAPEGKPEAGTTPSEKPEEKSQPAPEAPVTKTEDTGTPEVKAEEKPETKADENNQNADAQPETKVEEKKAAPPAEIVPFKFEKTYISEALTLVHPSDDKNKKNWAEIRLKDQDAKKLFETLRIEPKKTKETDSWQAGLLKHGYHISCYQQESKANPGTIANGCTLFMNYSTGAMLRKVSKIKPDPSVAVLKETYKGQSLQLIADVNKWGWIQLKGLDAKALFYTLKGDAVVVDTKNKDLLPSKQKARGNIVCYEHPPVKSPTEPLYACSLNINYETGAALILAQ